MLPLLEWLQLLEGKDGRAPAKSVLCLQSPLRFYPACLSDLEMQREQTYYKRSWCFSAHHHHRVAKVGKLVWDLHVARKRAVTVATCLTCGVVKNIILYMQVFSIVPGSFRIHGDTFSRNFSGNRHLFNLWRAQSRSFTLVSSWYSCAWYTVHSWML